MTRSEETLDLLTRASEGSVFLDEIVEYVVGSKGVVDPGDVGSVVTIAAMVSQLWDDLHASQSQAGLLADESGRITFVAWARADPPLVEEGHRYRFDNVEVSEYDGRREIHFTHDTTVEEMDQ